MTEHTQFNLLKFVYGELYLNSLNKTVATYTVPTWKAYKWHNILQWLVSNKHISALNILKPILGDTNADLSDFLDNIDTLETLFPAVVFELCAIHSNH